MIFALIKLSFITIKKQKIPFDNAKVNFKKLYKPLIKGSTKPLLEKVEKLRKK